MRKHLFILILSAALPTVPLGTPALAESAFIDAPQPAAADQQPVLSQSDHWAWPLLLTIALALFLPAAILGPWIHRRTAGELPELHTAQEQNPHAASQHEPGHTA